MDFVPFITTLKVTENRLLEPLLEMTSKKIHAKHCMVLLASLAKIGTILAHRISAISAINTDILPPSPISI